MKETYYSRHKEEILERQKKYIESNKEKVLQQKREWQRKYRAKLREKGLLPPTKKQLEQENKQLKEQLENDIDRYEDTISYQLGFDKGKEYLQQKIDNVNKYIDDLLEKGNDKTILEAIKFMLGDKENEK